MGSALGCWRSDSPHLALPPLPSPTTVRGYSASPNQNAGEGGWHDAAIRAACAGTGGSGTWAVLWAVGVQIAHTSLSLHYLVLRQYGAIAPARTGMQGKGDGMTPQSERHERRWEAAVQGQCFGLDI